MNDWDLRIFETVARTGGIGRAAVELNTAQSNVTTRMRHLEEELDELLFLRHSRGVTLTAAGQRLRPYAVQILQLLEQGRRAAKDSGASSGRLLLGSLETTAAIRLPAVLAAYCRAFPEVDLSLTIGHSASLIEDVLEFRLDGAFVTGPVRHTELVSVAVFREELVLVSGRAVRNLNQLSGVSHLKVLVLRAGCSHRRQLESLLSRHGIVGTRIQEFGSLEAILGCVGAGVGVTLLPRALVDDVAREGVFSIHTLPSAEADVETVFIRRANSYLSTSMNELLRLVKYDLSTLEIAAKR